MTTIRPPCDGPALPPGILVVDDTELRDSLTRMLWSAGLERTIALRTAREALMVMAQNPPALIILDVSLARDDCYPDGCVAGLDFKQRWPPLRLLWITGYSPGDPELTACPKGAPMIEKPFGPQAFVHRVKDVLVRPPWRPA